MKIIKILLFAIVAITTICIINIGLYFVSMASTIANVFGALLVISWIYALCVLYIPLLSSKWPFK